MKPSAAAQSLRTLITSRRLARRIVRELGPIGQYQYSAMS